MDELKNYQEDLLDNAERRFKSGLTEVMNLAIIDLENKEKPTENQNQDQVNNTTEINNLKQEIKKLYSQLQNQTNNRTNSRYNSRQQQGNRFGKQHYCWTHGARGVH